MNPRWRALKLAGKSSPDGERDPIPWPYPLASSSSPAPSPFWTEVVSFFPRLYFSRFIFNLNANFVVNRPLRDGPNANWTVVVVKAVFRLGHLFFSFFYFIEKPTFHSRQFAPSFSSSSSLPTTSSSLPTATTHPIAMFSHIVTDVFAVNSPSLRSRIYVNQAFAVWAIA